MTGKEIYEEKFKQKTEAMIADNPDKPYLKGFFNFMGNSLSCSTKFNYVYFVVTFMNSNGKSVEELDFDDYTEFLARISNATSSYQIGVYSGLKKFATYLVASRKAEYNPMDNIKRPKFIEKEETIKKREKGYLEKREIKKYISSVKNGVGSDRARAKQDRWKDRDLLIVLLFLNTGMRCSALYKLDVESINLENKTLMVHDKGDKIRQYILSDDLIECAKVWISNREALLSEKEESALFISNERTRMCQKSISRVVNKYAADIKGKTISPHKLRATYGTQLLEATRDIYFVQQCMGHSNPSTTELYIRGQNTDNEEKASGIMSRITFG